MIAWFHDSIFEYFQTDYNGVFIEKRRYPIVTAKRNVFQQTIQL